MASSLAVALIYIMLLRGMLNQYRNLSSSVLNMDRIEQALYRMEGANNGFLLTGDNNFRSSFTAQRNILSANYQEVLIFTADDSLQQGRLKKFKAKLTQWFALYNPIIIRRRTTQATTSDEVGLSSKQREELRQCKQLFEEMLSSLEEIRSTQEYRSNHWEESEASSS